MNSRAMVLLGGAATVGAFWAWGALRRQRRRISLDNRVVIVTGASSGHGFVVAQHAARAGAHLVLAARSVERLQQAATDLGRLGARSVLVVPTDVSDEAQVRSLVDKVVTRHGRIDVLINNAGVIDVGPQETMTLQDFREAMDTNFWGAVHTTLAVLPHMRRQGFGRIGNVVSLGGKAAMPHLLPYTASKFALSGFTEGLRAELAKDNIFVTGVYPATMRTGGHTHARFKGEREAEYAWFAFTDTVPGFSVSADHVARRLWEAVCDGEAEVQVGWQTRTAVVMQNLMPNTTAELAALVNTWLPGPGEGGQEAVAGEELQGKAAALFNRAVPSNARPGMT